MERANYERGTGQFNTEGTEHKNWIQSLIQQKQVPSNVCVRPNADGAKATLSLHQTRAKLSLVEERHLTHPRTAVAPCDQEV